MVNDNISTHKFPLNKGLAFQLSNKTFNFLSVSLITPASLNASINFAIDVKFVFSVVDNVYYFLYMKIKKITS